MATRIKRLVVVFYRTEGGKEPVREWLKALGDENRRAIGADLKTVEYGWPLGMPLCRQLAGYEGLWEVRTNLTVGIARTFFCTRKQEMILLHGIIKKSQKTPKNDIQIAVKRMKQVLI